MRQYSEKFESAQQFDVSQGVLPPLFNFGNTSLDETNPQLSVPYVSVTYKSEIFEWFIKFFHELLIKYWIWVVATMLMIMSLSGSKVVIYRIVYMFLFLTFTNMFQVRIFVIILFDRIMLFLLE